MRRIAAKHDAEFPMIDLRRDPLFDRTVLVAEQRGDRPNEFAERWANQSGPPRAASVSCPFCAGHEAETPPAVFERCDSEGRWRVRVVPNKYPVVRPDDVSDEAGAHEVVIESPRHVARPGELSPEEWADVLAAYRQRLRHWRGTGRFRYGLIFKNVGAAAGASLIHVHSQVIALRFVPPAIQREIDRLEEYRQQNGECGLCARLADECHLQQRIVLESDAYVAFCPDASLQPYETWIVPRQHAASFEGEFGAGDDCLPLLLHDVLARVERTVSGASYNMIVHTSPWGTVLDGYHWRIEIRPRITGLAGLELASGVHINQVSPERSARQLRNG